MKPVHDCATCSVAATAELIAAKWTPLLLHDLSEGPRRFNQLEHACPGISPRTLSERLRGLEQEGIVLRHSYPSRRRARRVRADGQGQRAASDHRRDAPVRTEMADRRAAQAPAQGRGSAIAAQRGSRSSAPARSARRCSPACSAPAGRTWRSAPAPGADRRAPRAPRRRGDALANPEAIDGAEGARRRRQAAGHRGAPRRDRLADHPRAARGVGRRRDPDGRDRAPPGARSPVVRAMPNAPSTVHEGIAGVCVGAHGSPEDLALARRCSPRWGTPFRCPSPTWTRSRPSPARPGVFRPPRGGHDRGRDPARPLARRLDPARRPRRCSAPPRSSATRNAPRGAAGGRDLARRDDHPGDPASSRSPASGQARVPQCDQRRDGASPASSRAESSVARIAPA